MKHYTIFAALVRILTACAPAQAETPTPTLVPATATTAPTNTPEPTATQEALPSATVPPTATPTPQKASFDVSGLTLEHQIDPECVNQFPVTQESSVGTKVLCVTFDNWVFGNEENPIMLDGDYEMIVGAEGWFEQDGQKVAVIVPLATRSRKINEIQMNRMKVRDWASYFYDADEGFWEAKTLLSPGMTLNIIINFEGMLSGTLSGNSTQGFGFEAAAYTQEDIEALFATGDAAGFGNILWPVINIAERQ